MPGTATIGWIRTTEGGPRPSFDLATTINSTGNGDVTFSHTVSGSNRFLLVSISTNTSISITGVTYNGVTMTALAAAVDNTDSSANSRLHVFRLIAPATGANNVVVTFSGAPSDRTVIAESFTDVNQTTPMGTVATSTTNNSASPSVTVVGASGDLIVDFHGANDALSTTSAGSGQTSRASSLPSTGSISSTENGGASVVMDWSNTPDRWYSSLGVALKPT